MQKGDSDSKHRDSRFGTRLGLGIGLEIQSCLSLGLGLDSKTRSFWSQTRNRVSKSGTRETLLFCVFGLFEVTCAFGKMWWHFESGMFHFRFRGYIKALLTSVRTVCCQPGSLFRSHSKSSLDIGVVPVDRYNNQSNFIIYISSSWLGIENFIF